MTQKEYPIKPLKTYLINGTQLMAYSREQAEELYQYIQLHHKHQ